MGAMLLCNPTLIVCYIGVAIAGVGTMSLEEYGTIQESSAVYIYFFLSIKSKMDYIAIKYSVYIK